MLIGYEDGGIAEAVGDPMCGVIAVGDHAAMTWNPACGPETLGLAVTVTTAPKRPTSQNIEALHF
jgi:hypothetical protein